MNYEKNYCLDIYYIKSENLTELKTSNFTNNCHCSQIKVLRVLSHCELDRRRREIYATLWKDFVTS